MPKTILSRHTKRARALWPVLALLIELSFRPTAAAESRIEREGLLIRLEQMANPVPSYTSFRVRVENRNPAPRTLYGKITLNEKDESGGGKGPVRGSCLVYVEIPAGRSVEKTVPCRGEGFSFWNFYILKIYEFIPPADESGES